jgi:type IV pilus assembly protein PilX
MNNLSSISQQKQQGYVLLTTLVLTIMITVMALTQVSSKTEGALNEALNRIINSTYTTEAFLRNTNGLYLFDQTAAPLWKTVNWSSTAQVINSFQGSSGTQASYIVEQLPSVVQPGQNMSKPTRVYRATARSVGANGNTSVMIQSTVQIQQ